MLFKKKKSGCQHEKTTVTKIIEREKVWYKCETCGEEVTTLKRKLMNGWVRYQRWRGEGYSFTNFFKEFMLNMVQGSTILIYLKVLKDITLDWQYLAIFFILWEIFNVWFGNKLIYKIRLPEAEVDYNSRLGVLNPVQREILDRLEKNEEDNAEILEKLTKKNENQD